MLIPMLFSLSLDHKELLVCQARWPNPQSVKLLSGRNVFSNNPKMISQDYLILCLVGGQGGVINSVFTTLEERPVSSCRAAVHSPICVSFPLALLLQTSLFGEGTYLTSDLSLALIYSPHGHGWQHSLLGPILSCVAVCEVIDHPDVKCQTKKKGE